MDVVLLYPKFRTVKDKYTIGGGGNGMYPPLDMGWIGRLLEEDGGISFKIVDANANRYALGELRAILKGLDPKIIVTTSASYESYRCMAMTEEHLSVHKLLIKEVRGLLPECKIVLIGPHGTALPEHVFKENPALDIIVRGEPEFTTFDLLKTLVGGKGTACLADLADIAGITFRREGVLVSNADRGYPEDINSLSYPAFHLLEMEKYLTYHKRNRGRRKMISVSSRGCPYKCIYCFQAMTGTRFRARSVENVMEEIGVLHKEYGVDHISFTDDIFTFDQKRVTAISARLVEEAYDLTWDCETRVDNLSKELLKEMADAGCVEILLGVESLVEEVRKSARKNIDMEKVKEMVLYAEKVGIYCISALQFGLPGDSWDSIDRNMEEMKKVDVPLSLPLITRAYPNTKLYELGCETGQIKEETFQACIDASGLIGTGFKDHEEYYAALNEYHRRMKGRKKKPTLQRIKKEIRRGIKRLRVKLG